MNINSTLINLYHVCKREMWLHANCIRFEHTSDTVYEGKLIHENSYPFRNSKYEEVEISGSKIDFYDRKNKVIHEIKKSDKIEDAHIWQLKFYIYLFLQNGISDVSGVIEYPTIRQTTKVQLTEDDILYLDKTVKEIEEIVNSEVCPPIIKTKICRSCSYYEFCYVNENVIQE